MSRRLAHQGFNDYRRSDALALRWLVRTSLPLGAFTTTLGVSRQSARKVASGLVERGFAHVNVDTNDSRRRNVELTASGREYGRAVIDVIHAIDDELRSKLDPASIDVARDVLSFVRDTFGP
jgi:DNA-binding MarR family transcriptional regulator